MPSTSPLLPDESARLDSLRAYRILDTSPDPKFDAITQLASRVLDVPIVLVSLIDEHRQWFKSTVGPIAQGSETQRSLAFCAHALEFPDMTLIVEDATKDPRFAQHPFVVNDPKIRFYAGSPLIGMENYPLGTLCVLDTQARTFSAEAVQILKDLSFTLSSVLDLHRRSLALQESEEQYRQTIELSPQIPWTADQSGNITTVGPRWHAITGMSAERALGREWLKAVHPDDLQSTVRSWEEARDSARPVDIEYRLRTRDGSHRWFRAYGAPHRGPSGAVVRWYGTVEDIQDRKLSQDRADHMANHDSLTGLANLRLFRENLQRAIDRSITGAGFALLGIDLDEFKSVNDTCGHHAGDALLCRVAEILTCCVGSGGSVARVGGDEFFVIAPHEEAERLAQQIQSAFLVPMQVDGQNIWTGASIGITLCPEDGVDVEKILQNVDLALYRAKHQGRQTYCFFEPAMDDRIRREHAINVDLRTAIDRGELELAYQPIVGLVSQKTEGFEALMRWNRHRQGPVSPEEFIPVAEKTGLIIPLGRWALQRACHDAVGLPGHLKMAVNLSSVQFTQRDLPQAVEAALSASGLTPDRLELEITETVRLMDNDANMAVLMQLKEIGVGIALDDFGVGYASLGYLQSFAFDRIKIDRSFVQRLAEGAGAQAIVRAIIVMAKALGIAVTAEGVETMEQFDFLRAEGCDHAQGYLLGKPAKVADISL